MCAESTTNSSFNAGSEQGSLATRLEDSTGAVWIKARALSETANGKCGSVLRSLPSSAISAKVWPELANSFSAEAGLKATPSCCPGVSLNSEPARSMDGSLRLAEMRDQGMSIEAGLKMVITPATPAASRDFQRSPAV